MNTSSDSNRPLASSTGKAASHPTPVGATPQTDTSEAYAVAAQAQSGPQGTSSRAPTATPREGWQESQA